MKNLLWFIRNHLSYEEKQKKIERDRFKGEASSKEGEVKNSLK